ncbi:hypothetical protein BISA_1847 [Bifidobacterium saguini DSM 23967]|uniref:Uncharacterized protein n=1 Tax=Bifidobacterium saguini DSM 23967 TaxID=1437607 RepID=A0A087D6U9_9BIFI|nr:hypothetical protein [Bifidobacterium saguini]KFI91249.1 hypothetical protein BISA_1847 [Bifidobacterium saguini DSM 23967]
MNLLDVFEVVCYLTGVGLCCRLLQTTSDGPMEPFRGVWKLLLVLFALQTGVGCLAFREPWGAPVSFVQILNVMLAVFADLLLAYRLFGGAGRTGR